MLDAVAYQSNSEKIWVIKEKSEALLPRRLHCQFMAGHLLFVLHRLRNRSVYSELANPRCRQDLSDDLQDTIDWREFPHTLYNGRKLWCPHFPRHNLSLGSAGRWSLHTPRFRITFSSSYSVDRATVVREWPGNGIGKREVLYNMEKWFVDFLVSPR